MPPRPITRLRRICLGFPEAHEVEAWGEPTFRVKNKLFAMFASVGTHHTADRDAVWVKAARGNQAVMVSADPQRYFAPPYVGPSGWVGVHLDVRTDWDELAELLRDAYVLTAPKKLLKALGAGPSARSARSGRRPKGT